MWITIKRTDVKRNQCECYKNTGNCHFAISYFYRKTWNYPTEFHETWCVARTPYVVVHIVRKFWFLWFLLELWPFELKNLLVIIMYQLVITTFLKLPYWFSWNLLHVYSKTPYAVVHIVRKFWCFDFLLEIWPFESTGNLHVSDCHHNYSETTKQKLLKLCINQERHM